MHDDVCSKIPINPISACGNSLIRTGIEWVLVAESVKLANDVVAFIVTEMSEFVTLYDIVE